MISIIAALDKNRLIGSTKGLPWYLPADLVHFKKVTLGKPVIMGRRTHETIGKPLPERKNIVLTRDEDFRAPGCIVVHSTEEALRKAAEHPPAGGEIMIIGGGQIYKEFLPLTDRMYLTLIDHEFTGDVYFPEFDWNEWREVKREEHEPDSKNPYKYTFVTLERKGIEQRG